MPPWGHTESVCHYVGYPSIADYTIVAERGACNLSCKVSYIQSA